MTEWLQELTLLNEVEYRARRIIATLATVGVDGRPRARTIIVRDVDMQSGDIWITTDGRSAKIGEPTANPAVELVFWAAHERVQFRVRGLMEIVHDGQNREDLWQALNDASRAMFFWPSPGAERGPGEVFREAAGFDVPAPKAFVALVLHPGEVEALELNDFPHHRRRWTAAGAWAVELLNP